MKAFYEEPIAELIRFDREDILCTSDEDNETEPDVLNVVVGRSIE